MQFMDNDGATHEVELKKCPFCDSLAKINTIGNKHTKSRKVEIRCSKMGCCRGFVVGARIHDFDFCVKRAQGSWNNRVNE